jgi:hypothetical protein
LSGFSIGVKEWHINAANLGEKRRETRLRLIAGKPVRVLRLKA